MGQENFTKQITKVPKGVFLRFYLFLETGRETDVWLPCVHPHLDIRPTTQACALTGNPTGEPFGLQAAARSTEPQKPWPAAKGCCIHDTSVGSYQERRF